MKKYILFSLLFVAVFGLTACSDSDKPLTEAQQAEKYNMSTDEYKEMKDAAARMNMTIDEHMKMTDMSQMNHDSMDMTDDSHMIEDDTESMTADEKMHMETMHKGENMGIHGSDEHRDY